MSRANVSLEDVKNVSKAVSVAESTATSTVAQIESSVRNNISTLVSAYQRVETVLSTCNRSLIQLQRMRMDAEKRLSALKKEFCDTPTNNPRYIELQSEISSVTQKINECNSLIRNFNALASDCAKQKEVISAAKYSLCSICDELKATKDEYTTKCETAIKRLSDISAMINAYMSVKISGGSSSGVGVNYSAPAAKSGGFGAFVKKTLAIGSMASAVVSPVTAVSSNGMNGLAEQQQEAYHNLDLKEKGKAAEKESELAIKENNTPKVLSPTQTEEDLLITVTQDGKNVDYVVSVDSENSDEKSPLRVDMSTEAKGDEKLSSEIAGEQSDSKDDSANPRDSSNFVDKNSKGVSKENDEELSSEQKKDDSSKKSKSFGKTAGLIFGVAVASLSKQGAPAILNVENTNNVSVNTQSASNNNSFIENLTSETDLYKIKSYKVDSSGVVTEVHSEDDLPKEEAPTMVETVQELADLTTDVMEEIFDPISVKHDKERRKEAEESKQKQEEHKKKKQLILQKKEHWRQQEEKRSFAAKQAIKFNIKSRR